MFKTTPKLLTALAFGIFLVSGGAVFATLDQCTEECWAAGIQCQRECHDAACRIECFLTMEDCIIECEDKFPDDYNKIKSKLSKGHKK